MKKITTYTLVFYALLILAVMSFIFAGFGVYSMQSFLKYAQKSQGEIVAYQIQRKVYKPVVIFTASDKSIVKFTASLGYSDTTKIPKGRKISILYHPKAPQVAEIDNFWHLWMNTLMILLWGTGPFLVMIFLQLILKYPIQSPKIESDQTIP